MATRMRSVAHWTAIALILALSALGLNGAVHELPSAATVGQQTATATQFGYALVGLIAVGALFARRQWARRPLWIWAGLITRTGGLAPVVWGEASLLTGFAAAVASAAIAAAVFWLAARGK
jgi:hypothetical protein